MTLSLRQATLRDALPCGSICHEAFRVIAEEHGFVPDFPDGESAIKMLSAHFARSDVHAIVAELDGRIVGSVCLLLRSPFAGLGPITVEPSAQSRAIGRRLMEEVLARAAKERFQGVLLVQDAYHSRSLALYTKLGFDVRISLSLLKGNVREGQIPGHVVRPAAEGDIDACNQLCQSLHGHDRGAELLAAVERGTAMVALQGGRVAGYSTSISFYGHAIGESNAALFALLGAAGEIRAPGALLPTHNGEALRFCLERGLTVVKPMSLMSLGAYTEPAGAFLPSILG